ncbi:hypothetical protein [Butyrivibrio sp. FCS014]|nr:hypothetical protein [Butyrivibrio sp. FCS014]
MKLQRKMGRTLESNIKLTANDIDTIRMMMDPEVSDHRFLMY